VRYRHLVCDKWIAEGRTLSYVIQNLKAANFDPEFFATHEHEVAKLYTAKTGKQVQQNSRGSLLSTIFAKYKLAKPATTHSAK
jgi:3-phenylpropionate/trans-cinnamate dioxygenase ferredoxin reductase component